MSELHTKKVDFTIEKASSSALDFVLSSNSVDRVGDVIETSALEKVANSVSKILCLYQHDSDRPVGFWDSLKVDSGRLKGRLNLAPTNLGKMLQALLNHGTPLGASVGFKGKGTPRKEGGFTFKEIEIFETSIVSVPCNPDCYQIAKSFGLEEFVQPQSEGEDYEGASARCIEETMRNAKAAILAANQTIRRKV